MKRPPSWLSVLEETEAQRDDYLPTASWDNLRRRAALLRRVRAFFDERGFLEVETPVLSADTVVDRHLDPFQTGVPREPGRPSRRFWLQTSPEFAMKRLLVAGNVTSDSATSENAEDEPPTAIYQIARVFRLDEFGPRHNPEFTMVEWYRTGDGLDEAMQLTGELCEATLDRGPAERISYADAFAEHVGVCPHTGMTEELIAAAERHEINVSGSMSEMDRDGWLNLLFAERVQPRLGVKQPTLLYDYPASQAALAVVRHDSSPVAERFELFVDGLELANGYHELLDADELRRRNQAVNRERFGDGKRTLPEQSRLLKAMDAGLPACAGVALGFDRLAMLALGAKTLTEVIAFPFDRA